MNANKFVNIFFAVFLVWLAAELKITYVYYSAVFAYDAKTPGTQLNAICKDLERGGSGLSAAMLMSMLNAIGFLDKAFEGSWFKASAKESLISTVQSCSAGHFNLNGN